MGTRNEHFWDNLKKNTDTFFKKPQGGVKILHSCYWVGRNLKTSGNQNEHKIYPASKYWSPGRPTPTISGRPLRILFNHPGDVPIWRPLEDLQNTSLGQSEAISWMLLFSFLNLFDWPYLYKSNSVFKVCLEHRRISKMELFCEISEWLLSVNYFSVRTSSENVDWVLDTPLILSSNVIWHVDRSIAETKIFRLGVSLIRPWYVQKEEWIGKKLYYRKIKYITSNTENCKVYLQYLITFLKILYKSTLNF